MTAACTCGKRWCCRGSDSCRMDWKRSARRCVTSAMHQDHRQAVRAGHVPSSLVLGGRRVEIRRPRARNTDGHELRLPGWQTWSLHDPLEERAFE